MIIYFRDKGLNDALTHAVNAIILFLDLFINANPPRYCHFIHNLWFGLCYAIFSIFYTICGGINRDSEPFIYSVLNWKYDTSGASLFAFLTLVFLVLMHFALTFCVQLRIWIYKKMYHHESTKDITNDSGINNSAYEV